MIDARGLSCPEPIMLTDQALKESNEQVKVLVTEPHQKMTVEKLAKRKGLSYTSNETEDGFEVIIR